MVLKASNVFDSFDINQIYFMSPKNTSKVEITNISAHGVWLLVKQREHFLPFDTFSGFKDANIADVLNVKIEHGEYDLELDSIENPEKYPLRYK